MTLSAAIERACDTLAAASAKGDPQAALDACETALRHLTAATERAERARADAARQRALNVEAIKDAGGLPNPAIGRALALTLIRLKTDALTDDAVQTLVNLLPPPFPSPSRLLPARLAALAAFLSPPRAHPPVNDP